MADWSCRFSSVAGRTPRGPVHSGTGRSCEAFRNTPYGRGTFRPAARAASHCSAVIWLRGTLGPATSPGGTTVAAAAGGGAADARARPRGALLPPRRPVPRAGLNKAFNLASSAAGPAGSRSAASYRAISAAVLGPGGGGAGEAGVLGVCAPRLSRPRLLGVSSREAKGRSSRSEDASREGW